MIILPLMLVNVILVWFPSQIFSETDTITQYLSLLDGKTLVSQGGTFELGFFTPSTSSTNRYLGIWFKKVSVKTVVWVANSDHPINDNSSCQLSISKEGDLVIVSNNGSTIHWSTKGKGKGSSSSGVIAQLLDSGNLVVREDNKKEINDSAGYLWQSFDYPSDTILPGMKLGWNLTSGFNRRITAWKNWDDPSSGHLTYGFTRSDNNPEQQMWNGSSMLYRSGPWNGLRFSATQSLNHHALFKVDFVYKKDQYYYFQYNPLDPSLISRIVINQTVYALQRLTWVEENQTWKLYLNVPRDECDNYNRCGSFRCCGMSGKSSVCNCLSGFSYQNSQGCVRSESWRCREKNKDSFIRFQNMKLPDTNKSWIDGSITLEECKAKCWENCSCTAYANSDITGAGSGCIIWFGHLLDMRQLPSVGQDLYVRLPPAPKIEAKGGSKKTMLVRVASIVSSIFLMLLITFTFIYWRIKTKFREQTRIKKTKVQKNESEQEDLELPLFDLNTIVSATDDFSSDKKLGEGGFGPVYRGTLPDGQDVAIKRLSNSSAQGIQEFKNEVIFCSKLQHRNLVKVLGYCIEEQEKLLVYEYMPNKSLDFFLFDSSQRKYLDWSRRFNIISGIARGLLYLHQDSRFRIIHRDLKTSNILLDEDMNPKISDFGLARMCGGDQVEGNTSKVVGTYGYMAPEYAIDGIFSIRSDVYSFGIILLEILSGKKNKGLSYLNNSYNLVGHAWRLWKECIPMEFIDTCLEDLYIEPEASRCIHIGLLCVQHHPEDRPTMASVVVMLTSESTLPQPKKPIFLREKVSVTSGQKMCHSTNEVTISVMEPR